MLGGLEDRFLYLHVGRFLAFLRIVFVCIQLLIA